MKIILSVTAPDLQAAPDPRFGRGAFLLVVDTDSGQVQGYPNPGVNASGGAGVQAAQFAADQKVEAVISGDFGPNAFNALSAAGISMYLFGDCRSAAEAVENFKAGRLQKVGSPTQGGHRA